MSHHIPFDLKRALAGDSVVRRDDVPVIEVLRFKSGNVLRPIISLSENGQQTQHYDNGAAHHDHTSHLDLFMVPNEKKVYRLAFRNLEGEIELAVVKFSDRQSAEHMAANLPLPDVQVVEFKVTA